MSAELAADGPSPHDILTLEDLRLAWSGVYDVGWAGGEFHAFRLTDRVSVSASTVEGLDSALRADWDRRGDGEYPAPASPPWEAA